VQTNGAAVAAGIASGALDIGNTSVTTLLLAHEKGLPFSIVAGASLHDPRLSINDGALVLKDSPLVLGADANNAVIGVVSLSGMGHDAFCSWVDQHGGDPSSIRFVEIPFSAGAGALEEHRVIATEASEPTMAAALDTGKFRTIPTYNAIGSVFAVGVWFTNKDFSAKNPEIVRMFARVVATVAPYANTHHAETAQIMSGFTGIPLDVMLRMPRSVMAAKFDPSLIQPAITAAAKYGLLKKSFAARELIDPNVLS